jgi:hypothetical protein
MADDWRALLTEYAHATNLFERASRTLTRALVTSSVPRDEIEALVEAEAKARDAAALARLRLVNLWRATTSAEIDDGMAPLSSEALEIARQYNELDDQDRELITRLIHLAAASPRSVREDVSQRLIAPPKPKTQAELRGRVEAVIAYIDDLAREPGIAETPDGKDTSCDTSN